MDNKTSGLADAAGSTGIGTHADGVGQAPSRRTFMRQAAALGLAGGAGLPLSGCGGAEAGAITFGLFRHGVASGDPLADRVIIWTRATPDVDMPVTLRWEVSSDAAFSRIAASGSVSTGMDRDYTIKVDVTGLQPGSVYYYRFIGGAESSPEGRTKTLPAAGVRQVRLAVFSCANFAAGYFHPYGEVSRRDDIDCALHLGDYIYETSDSGSEGLLPSFLGRDLEPDHELYTLQDYRRRHAQYRNDLQLRALHAWVPVIAVWDDHDIINGTWRRGAGDHDPVAEGFIARRSAAIQAWREWLPVHDRPAQDPLQVYRSFDFGDLLSLHMLDTRVIGRDQPVSPAQFLAGAADGAQRQLLGPEQSAWLGARMQASSATWQVLGQQVLIGRMHIPLSIASDFTQDKFSEYFAAQDLPEAQRSDYQRGLLVQPHVPLDLDTWDGYPAARESVLNLARSLDKNLVVLSGDSHNAWASDLRDAGGAAVGVEFAGASVSSPGLEATYLRIDSSYLVAALTRLLPDLKYAQTNRRGYLVVTFTPEQALADWVHVSTVLHHSYNLDAIMALRVLPGAGQRKLLAV